MTSTDKYKVFLASPDDSAEERRISEKIVGDLNETIGSRNGFIIELLKWENSTYPEFGEDGQDVINKQIGDDYDIFIGVMWKKFGTPTKRAGSGTEEEFERAYKRYKGDNRLKIMFYFNQDSIPQDADLEQFSKVKEFKRKVSDLGGLYWLYSGSSNFEDLLRRHLTNCVLDLRKSQESNDSSPQPFDRNIFQLKHEFEKYLNDVEVVFAHSKVDNVTLEDVYIPPDLRNINERQSKAYSTKNLDTISDAIDVDGIKFVLIGNDLAGKTANCKYLFKKYYHFGLRPVLLKGSDFNNNIRTDSLIKLINERLSEQYEKFSEFDLGEGSEFVLIIDDFHKATKGKNRYWARLIQNFDSLCPNIIISGSTLMPIETLEGQDPFKDFNIYSILEFGPKFRYELVYRWFTLGIEEKFVDQNELRRKIDDALAHIKTIIGKGYIPVYPFYLLSVLQSLETGNNQSLNYSIHGFYYEHLINESFTKAVIDKKEISLFYNYLTYLCFHLFEQQIYELDKEDFRVFHIAYCDKYDLTYSADKLLQALEKAKLLRIADTVQVKEKYIYYFFVAKYIATNISKPEIKDLIGKMSSRIFRDEYASIMMFVTHLSKDVIIIQDLLEKANSLFSDIPICKLEEDVNKVNDLIESIPEQVLELINVDERRKEALEVEEDDEKEQIERRLDREPPSFDDIGLDDDCSHIDIYARITLALKTIDILGQIARKYWGELDGDKKLEIVSATYNLGLRTLGFYLDLLQQNSEQIVKHIKELITEKHIRDKFTLEKNIEETARNYLFRLCFLSSFGLTKRVSNSIGYDRLKNSFEKALEANPLNSVKLIDLSIKLGYSSIKSQVETIEEHGVTLKTNKLGFMVLRSLAIDHLYMFDTDYKTRAKLFQILKISEKEQLIIDATSKVKKNTIIRTTKVIGKGS